MIEPSRQHRLEIYDLEIRQQKLKAAPFPLQSQDEGGCSSTQFRGLPLWDGYLVPCGRDRSFPFACHRKSLKRFPALHASRPTAGEYHA